MGDSVDNQVAEPTFRIGRVEVASYVESGIHLLADLIAQQQAAITGFSQPPLTSATANREGVKTDFFLIRPTSGLSDDIIGHDDWPNFFVPTFDFAVWWNKHAGRACFMDRPMKGREWSTIMMSAIASLSRERAPFDNGR